MERQYERADVVAIENPYREEKPRSAVVLTDERRPPRMDGVERYTVVMLSGTKEYGPDEWVKRLDKDEATPDDEEPLAKHSYVLPWMTTIVPEWDMKGPYTRLTEEAMRTVAKSYAAMLLK